MKAKKGSILVWVVILFAVIMITGTTLMAQVTQSHKSSLRQENQQQAYYAAQSILESCVRAFEEEPTMVAKFIGKGPSQEITYEDNAKGDWKCHVEITEDLRDTNLINIKVTSEGGGLLTTKGTAQAQLKKTTNTFQNDYLFKSEDGLTIVLPNQTRGIEGDILSTKGFVKIKSDDQPVEVKGSITAHTSVDIESRYKVNITGDIKAINDGVILKSLGLGVETEGIWAKGKIDIKGPSGILIKGAVTSEKDILLNGLTVETQGVWAKENIDINGHSGILMKGNATSEKDILLTSGHTTKVQRLKGQNVIVKSHRKFEYQGVEASGSFTLNGAPVKGAYNLSIEEKSSTIEKDIRENVIKDPSKEKVINVPIPEDTGKVLKEIVVSEQQGGGNPITITYVYEGNEEEAYEYLDGYTKRSDYIFVINIPTDRKVDVRITNLQGNQGGNNSIKLHVNTEKGNLIFDGGNGDKNKWLVNVKFEGSFSAKEILTNGYIHGLAFEYRNPSSDGITGSSTSYSLVQYSGG